MAQITATRQDIDLAIFKNENGHYDVSIDDEGDFATLNSLDTAIQLSLFCDVRADESEEPVNELRRGYWGNTLHDVDGFEVGSKLWLLSQAKNTVNTLNSAVDYARQCLQWFIDDNIAVDAKVNGEQTQNNIQLGIEFIRSNNDVESRFYELWNNTGKSELD
jgi:phage gp46-like protein